MKSLEYKATLVGSSGQAATMSYNGSVLAVGYWDTKIRLYSIDGLPPKPESA